MGDLLSRAKEILEDVHSGGSRADPVRRIAGALSLVVQHLDTAAPSKSVGYDLRHTRFEPELELLSVAQSLRMMATGSSDPLPGETALAYRAILKRKLETWRPTTREQDREYDDAVRALIAAAVREYEASFWFVKGMGDTR